MTITDWIVDIVLIVVVLRQVREVRIDRRFVLIPAIVVTYTLFHYATSVPNRGNNWWYIAGLLGLGTLLGIAGGLTTHVRAKEGRSFARAGLVAAAIWVVSMSARMGFLVWINYGSGKHWLFDFSVEHHITTRDVWQLGLLALALSEVVVRLGLIIARGQAAKGRESGVDHSELPSHESRAQIHHRQR